MFPVARLNYLSSSPNCKTGITKQMPASVPKFYSSRRFCQVCVCAHTLCVCAHTRLAHQPLCSLASKPE